MIAEADAADWPFDQGRRCAVFTIRPILERSAPILHVTHDADDHGWQFLGWEAPRQEDACIIALEEAAALDQSVLQLADLPPGWHAWRRTVADP